MNAKHFLVIAMLGLVGCQSGYFDLKEAVTPTDELNQRLLKDVATSIQANFLPAKTRFYFPHRKEKLAEALEASLRKYGYAISSDLKSREKSDIQLAYQFSEVEKGLFVLRVSIGEGLQINRLYSEAKDGEFIAAGPLLMRKG
ncbi:MAG: hypothetical protein NTX25_20950 [Proteobacteria bacterium]|nr:hypothetical protein [Pseudomonadota bacterium]